MNLKYERQSSWFLKTYYKDFIIRIGKDFGSMGRSKPLYFVELDGKIIQHGFNTQKDAKKYVLGEINNLK